MLGYSQDSTVAPSTSPAVYMTRGFIQIAGFTFGKATSFFDFVSTAAVAYNAGMLYTPDTGDAGQMVAAYTAQFGNGFSGTMSVEQTRRASTDGPRPDHHAVQPDRHHQSGRQQPRTVWRAAAVGQQDIVGNLRVDQAWGSAQVSAAVHDVSATYYAANAVHRRGRG